MRGTIPGVDIEYLGNMRGMISERIAREPFSTRMLLILDREGGQIAVRIGDSIGPRDCAHYAVVLQSYATMLDTETFGDAAEEPHDPPPEDA